MVKGNVIVGQSGGPTSVINSSLVGVFKAAKERGVHTVYGMKYGVEGLLEEQYINLTEHLNNELAIELLKRTPASYLGSCRYKLPEAEDNEDIYKKLFCILNKLNIEYFLYIGGNDSMDTIKKLSHYAKKINSSIVFMGVPKTIDNDLAVTDHTPGYGSAAKYISSTLKEIIKDSYVYNKKNITVVEIMGRNAGWLTGAAVLSRMEDCIGPDLICLPEIPIQVDGFVEIVSGLQKENKPLVIVVSEGLRMEDGRYICELNNKVGFTDPFGHKFLTGTASYLSNELAAKLGCRARAIEFNTMQRCAAHLVSRTDITEAFVAGGHAMKAAFEGETGKMIIFERISDDPYFINTRTHDINLIANIEKRVPREWITEDGTNVTKEFISYCRPLIQAELTPFMVDGVPRHLEPIR